MSTTKKHVAYHAQEPTVEFRPGIWKTTLAYTKELMICHFRMKKGCELALHTHEAAQNGYVISGKIEFFKADGTSVIVGPGDGYAFESNEAHGSIAHKEVTFIEAFAPLRPEYIVETKGE